MKRITLYFCTFCMILGLSGCSDFFDQESDHVIYSEKDHLDNATDTIYSMTGILSKLQALADRTILLGEVRGDLVDVTNIASNDLRQLAQFNVDDDNMYNAPRDYYAVINNCNYFIAHVDTAMKNNRNEYIFMREYAAVKAIRAWTYLQLVLNYGSVPFVTDPILTKEESELNYPRYDLPAVCEYFINDLLPLTEKYGREYPRYGTIRNTDSRFFYFPLNIVLGDLYLWAGSSTGNKEYYKQAALRYYKYISERNGDNSTYPTGTNIIYWSTGSTTWTNTIDSWTANTFMIEGYSNDSELITMIPCDSIRAEGNYSELRNLFNSRDENNYKVSIVPSERLKEISAAQEYCNVSVNGITSYSPKGLSNYLSGDLRLHACVYEGYTYDPSTGDRIETQNIYKYATRNVHIYRKQLVYLRLAEALNEAGYPHMAFSILSEGLNNDVIAYNTNWYNEDDANFMLSFDFPTARYIPVGLDEFVGVGGRLGYNTIGMHSRGSGLTTYNEYYMQPYLQLAEDYVVDSVVVNEDGTETSYVTLNKLTPEKIAILQDYVREQILQEGVLEFAFEGTRYYDIMRFALRDSNPGQYLANRIYARRGAENADIGRGEIKTDLTNKENWYLKWKGSIGF